MENPNLVLFYLKSGWESNTKKVENDSIFLTRIYLSSSDQCFRRYDLDDEGVAETVFLDKLQHRKKNRIWGCSDGIIPLS
jgi:hypothetical protein